MIKIYCEDGAMTKSIKILGKRTFIELVSFPFENKNKKTVNAKNPSELTWDSTLLTWDTEIISFNNVRSDIFKKIEEIVGKENYNDIRHIDTAYKEKCEIFITPDKKDIASKNEKLSKLTGIQFFYCENIDEINSYIEKIKNL